jgi:hypothetical protein
VDGCDTKVQSKGLCSTHYGRYWRGRPLGTPVRKKTPPTASAYERVMMRTERQGDCLVFTGESDARGYGLVSKPGNRMKRLRAHRVVLEHHYGPSPLNGLHSCDNPPCVEVEHLRWGTQAENIDDMVKRGRLVAQKFAFTPEQVAELRKDLRPARVLAEIHGVSKSTIQRARSGTAAYAEEPRDKDGVSRAKPKKKGRDV